ncbi:uncharacterized protein LOC144100876 [Amblyomma americanum]
MAVCVPVRVRLDLSCAIPRRNEHNLLWIVVDRSTTATIKQFAKLIRTKYGVDKRNELYLEDAWLPPDEPIQILRDRDLVRVISSVKNSSNSADHSDNGSEPTLASEEAATSSKKSKKRKLDASESSALHEAEPGNNTVNAFPDSHPAPATSAPSHDASAHLAVSGTPVWPATPKEPTTSSTTLQVPSLPSTPLGQQMLSTPDVSMSGSQAGSAKKKARRPRRKKKKPNDSEVGPIEPLPPVVLPVSSAPHLAPQAELPAKHLRFDEHSSSDEEQRSVLEQCVLPKSVEAAPYVASTTPSPVKVVQERQPPLTNGQAMWPPCAAGSYTAVPPPSQTAQPKAELQESYEEASEVESPEKKADSQPKQVKKSYAAYPPLKTPPRVGDLIAFKVLELDSTYCPNVSDYKEGKVMHHNPVSDMVLIELKNAEAKPTYGGKFELEVPEEGLPPMEKVVQLMWTELLEPVIMS